MHDAKLEIPQEKANGVRGGSCLVSGFYLDASGLSVILKSIFSRPFGSEVSTQDPHLRVGFILSGPSLCRIHFGLWLARHQTLPAPDLK